MKLVTRKSAPLSGGEIGLQFAALPYRMGADGRLEILLVTSRETRRWVIPKGWPMKGRTAYGCAAREAMEEAGVLGEIAQLSIGAFRYAKRLKTGADLLVHVEVFPLKVARQRKRWPERAERDSRWFSPEAAIEAVQEPELKALIADFARIPADQPMLHA